MGILLDILCIGLLAASAVVFAQKSVSSSLLSLGALLLALTAAFLLSLPLGAAGRPLIAPTVEKNASYRLADLFSAPHLATGRETVEALDFDELIQTNPPAFQKILDRYGADIGTLRSLPETHDSAAVLDAVTGRYSRTLSRAVSYAVLFWLVFLVGKLVQKRVEGGLVPPPPLRGARRLIPPALGLLAGLLWIFSLAVLLEWLVPVMGRDSVVFSEDMLKSASFYQILNQINLFIRL